MAQTPETKVKKKVKKWLAVNAKWWTPISDRYHIGLPDFLCILKTDIHHGKLTAIEAKSNVGRLTLRQLHDAKGILAAGGKYLVARPAESDEDRKRGFKLIEVNGVFKKEMAYEQCAS